MNKVRTDFFLDLLVFTIPFALVAGALHLTALVNYGPGDSSAWIATALNAGQHQSAWMSPMFRVLVKTVGLIFGNGELQRWLGLLTSVGLSAAAGFFSLFMMRIFKKMDVWEPPVVAILAGTLFGASRVIWAVGTDINPYPWVLVFLFASLWLLNLENKQANHYLLAAFFAGLASAFHLSAIVFSIIILGYMIFNMEVRGKLLLQAFILFLLPLAAFALPSDTLIFKTNGFFDTLVGYPGNFLGEGGVGNVKTVAWSAWVALTPIALIIAILGRFTLKYKPKRYNFDLLIIAMIMSLMYLKETYPIAAIMASVVIVFMFSLGLVAIAKRIPDGLILIAFILIPIFWFMNGPQVTKHGQTIWRDHAENVLRTIRYKTLVFSQEETLVNTPYAALLANEGVRSDIALVNPYRMIEPEYVNWVKDKYGPRFEALSEKFASLQEIVNNEAVNGAEKTAAAKSFIQDWIRLEVIKAGKAGGVLLYTGFDPEIEEYTLIPEGLLWRVYDGGDYYPFLFRTMKMEAIQFRPGASDLEHKAVALYPMMFTERGSWMLKNKYSAEGMDYIRWAQKIDPNYVPAGIVARQYGIYGEPQRLGVDS